MTDASASRSLLLDRGYMRVWSVGFFTAVVRWLEMLALGVLAFSLTNSPALVALLVILRFLPLALFGVVLGALADQLPAARMMRWGLAAMAALSAGMWALFRFGAPEYWHVAAAVLVSGVFWAGDLPIRRKIMAEIVGLRELARAMATDNAASTGTRAIGPLAGGALYQLVGVEGVFALSTALYVLALWAAAGLPREARAKGDARRRRIAMRWTAPLRGAAEAARHAWRDPDARRILGVTIVFNIWGFPFLAMVPVLGRDPLELSAFIVGALTGLEGLFAFIGSLVVARWARPGTWRRLYLGSVAVHLCAVGAIGLVGGIWTLALGLSAAGLAAAAFSTMQSTLIWSVAPTAMRGRYLGLMTLCIGAGVIGFANVGLTAERFGAETALVLLAAQGLPTLALIAWRWKAL
ncbi:MAG: MFS transporter [Pseudomonadota bacterium]